MAMDFSVVGSCSVGRNERWKGGRRGEEGRRGGGAGAVFLIGRKGPTRSLVTILEFRDTGIKKTFCLFVHEKVLKPFLYLSNGPA